MKVTPTAIPEVLIIEPKVFGDERGSFNESFNQKAFADATGVSASFVQDNHSRSARGAVFDVAVDIRRDSPTHGKWVGVELTEGNCRQMWVPPGFAHGFAVVSEWAEVLYKTTEYYGPAHERCIAWNDPTLCIEWPLSEPRLSEKDKQGHPMPVTVDLGAE